VRKGNPVIYPRCGNYGYLTRRWVKSTYYPRYVSVKCQRLEEEKRKLANDPGNKD
jgi:hypothetical protein